MENTGGILGGALAGGVVGAALPLAIPGFAFYGVCLVAGYAGTELGKIGINLLSSRPDYDDDFSEFV